MLRVNTINRQGLLKCLTFNPKSLVFKTVSVPLIPLTVPLNMLDEGTYNMEIFADGINADRDATDYTKTQRTVSRQDGLHIQLAPGGGWAAIVTPVAAN